MSTPSSSKRRGLPLLVASAIVVLAACAGPTPSPVPSPRGKGIVVVDPGHPSEYAKGASGPAGATEIQVNWAVAQKLRVLLEGAGYRVVVTKLVEDEVVTNRHRAEIGTLHGADIIVRLHCDAGSHRGTATFYPDRPGTNLGVTGPSQEVIDGSRALAEALHPAMIASLGPDWPDLGIKGDSKTAVGSRQGALTGSIFSTLPVVTVEMVVITQADQEAFIASEDGQARMARALAAGIEAYYAKR
ncbi:MAG TPA: N-acetylmuramoyl-L-alanine amidase [Longimicrobiales bacterium]|nr:N-acetylmuramoyl-L-alanine amidase [Longimicrobiales bacterium]